MEEERKAEEAVVVRVDFYMKPHIILGLVIMMLLSGLEELEDIVLIVEVMVKTLFLMI